MGCDSENDIYVLGQDFSSGSSCDVGGAPDCETVFVSVTSRTFLGCSYWNDFEHFDFFAGKHCRFGFDCANDAFGNRIDPCCGCSNDSGRDGYGDTDFDCEFENELVYSV